MGLGFRGLGVQGLGFYGYLVGFMIGEAPISTPLDPQYSTTLSMEIADFRKQPSVTFFFFYVLEVRTGSGRGLGQDGDTLIRSK